MTTLTAVHDFLKTAKEQYSILESMVKKINQLFKDTAKYFAFDPKKYTMEEFFGDLKTFCDQFNVSMKKEARFLGFRKWHQ